MGLGLPYHGLKPQAKAGSAGFSRLQPPKGGTSNMDARLTQAANEDGRSLP
jgi:hypothetical protein